MTRPVSPEGPAPLPCPFCGSAAVVDDKWLGNRTQVYCATGLCRVNRVVFEDSNRANAIAAWNRRPSRSAGSPETLGQDREAVIATFGQRITELESQRSNLREKVRGLPTISHRHPGDTPEHPTRYVRLNDVLSLVGWDIATLERDANKPAEQIVAATRERLAAPSPGEAGAPPDYVKINKAIHHIYELHHGEVLRAWEATHGPLRNDNLISIQQMRVELVREALGAALSGDREDSERMDWLSRLATVCAYDSAGRLLFSSHWAVGETSLREAIDAARLHQEKP